MPYLARFCAAMLFAVLATSASAQSVRVDLMRGAGPQFMSAGVDVLAGEVRKQFSSAKVTVWGWTQSGQIAQAIKSSKATTFIVFGYSCGASVANDVARNSGRRIALVAGIQPSLWCPGNFSVAPNVTRALDIYNPHFAETQGLGWGWYRPRGDRRIRYVEIADFHLPAINNPKAHQIVLDEIARAVK